MPKKPLAPRVGARARSTAALASDIDIENLIDDDDRRYLRFTRGTADITIPAALFAGSPSEAFRQLAEGNIPVISDKARRDLRTRIDELGPAKKVLIADRSGWMGKSFAMPSGLIVPEQLAGEEIHYVVGTNPGKWRKRGSYAKWRDHVAALAADQPLPTFALALAFAPPLLELAKHVENIGFEFVGEAERGKTTLLQLAGSVWGGDSSRPTGFAESWRVTDNGLEPLIVSHRNCLLILDEANLAPGTTDRQRGTFLGNAVFTLSQGVEKARHTNGGAVRSSRLLYLSSSNRPLIELLAGTDPARKAAIATRLVTIPVRGRLGVLDTLPARFKSAGDVAEYIKQAVTRHYGAALPRFIRRLVEERSKDPKGLEATIQGLMHRCLRRLKSDGASGEERRVANAFALVYAAGVLARRWNCLPTSLKILGAVRRCYRRHRASMRLPTAMHPIERYVESNRHRLYTLNAVRSGSVDVSKAAGFFGTVDGHPHLIVPTKIFRKAFKNATKLMRELRELGLAEVEQGAKLKLSKKVTLQSNTRAVRCYMIRMPTENPRT